MNGFSGTGWMKVMKTLLTMPSIQPKLIVGNFCWVRHTIFISEIYTNQEDWAQTSWFSDLWTFLNSKLITCCYAHFWTNEKEKRLKQQPNSFVVLDVFRYISLIFLFFYRCSRLLHYQDLLLNSAFSFIFGSLCWCDVFNKILIKVKVFLFV